jgi:hypothetical protein
MGGPGLGSQPFTGLGSVIGPACRRRTFKFDHGPTYLIDSMGPAPGLLNDSMGLLFDM